jgi:transcriptional regulator with XRE-family HTH domain
MSTRMEAVRNSGRRVSGRVARRGTLEELRKSRKPPLSAKAAARLVGVSISALRNWERGDAMPHADAALRYAQVLGIPVEELTRMVDLARSRKPRDAAAARVGS